MQRPIFNRVNRVKIRVFREKDRAEVIALWRASGLAVAQNDPSEDIDRKLKVNPELFLVYDLSGQIIGTVMGGYEGHRGWVNYLAVHESHQGNGYGKQLMIAVEQLLKEKGCPKVNLQVRESNRQAIAFYNALGYGDDRVIGLGKRF